MYEVRLVFACYVAFCEDDSVIRARRSLADGGLRQALFAVQAHLWRFTVLFEGTRRFRVKAQIFLVAGIALDVRWLVG